jgi:hypothetical protein
MLLQMASRNVSNTFIVLAEVYNCTRDHFEGMYLQWLQYFVFIKNKMILGTFWSYYVYRYAMHACVCVVEWLNCCRKLVKYAVQVPYHITYTDLSFLWVFLAFMGKSLMQFTTYHNLFSPYLLICSSLSSLTFPYLSSWVVSLNDLIWFQCVCTGPWNFCVLNQITLHIYLCISISVKKCYIYVYIFIADSCISPAREVCLKMICY